MEARYEHCEWLVPLVYMKRIALFFWIAFIALPGFGQVEQTQWTLVDAERDDRQIPCEVWYPSEPASTLPAVVFAHGFVMGADNYTGLAAALATEGYAFVSIATEQGFTPDHEAYGQDLAFVANEIAANAVGGVLEGPLVGTAWEVVPPGSPRLLNRKSTRCLRWPLPKPTHLPLPQVRP